MQIQRKDFIANSDLFTAQHPKNVNEIPIVVDEKILIKTSYIPYKK
jgi:hypothetical protein